VKCGFYTEFFGLVFNGFPLFYLVFLLHFSRADFMIFRSLL
jgi:hypothetical protein